MHHWREEDRRSPFLCVDCATHIAGGAAIVAMDGEHAGTLEENLLLVGASCARDS